MRPEAQRLALDRAENILRGMARCTEDKSRLREIKSLAKYIIDYRKWMETANYDPQWLHAMCIYLRQRLISLQLNPSATSAGNEIYA